ncbi:hypothetical protein [Bifidobacterium crudilactis]|jgi:hypothetical protein|uniref:Uncharacterized protein n=2 Tax=Bifidobacterium crudilactis TaxID=327277 RepID=A0A971CXE7_9BIFI|nr:hypothetical protein [Bifidobacterium crudilactis]MCI1868830.1 hypothetical protein [Bifidobacterium crudilactis]MDN5972996.1 hypothetical protein [Bifidobacterium crudilactis]MDN6000538.1 hypothetical protein [Bifidobacterium crudilactis]MDN6271457.1 hypothetical protein [Bifidobacterium crudilactis]MDN6467654.1 hypothetical protein [Bifidobacterium crudilactis]
MMTVENTNEVHAGAKDFVGYEYKNISVPSLDEGLYVDSYRSFGWSLESSEQDRLSNSVVLKFKRDRQIRNKAELSRLQRQFDSSALKIRALETAPESTARLLALCLGIIGCAFLAGATFSYMAGFIVAMVLLAIPGFLLWIVAYPVFVRTKASKTQKNAPQLDACFDAVYETSKQASQLL